MPRWNTGNIEWMRPHIRDICSKFDSPFTAEQVYDKLRFRLKLCPTYREMVHRLYKYPFIEKVGVWDNRVHYIYHQ